MFEYDVAILPKLTIDMVAVHVLPKRPCKPSDIRKEFIPLDEYPCKYYLLRNDRTEEIPEEEDLTQSTETCATKDFANSNKNATYVIVFDSFGSTECTMLHFNFLCLEQFKKLKEQFEKEKARAYKLFSSPPMILKFVFLASFNGVGNSQRIQNALEHTTGVEWSVKEAVPIPTSHTAGFSYHNKSENQTQSPQNNLNDEPIDYFSSRIKCHTDPSSLSEKQYILTTTFKKIRGASVKIISECVPPESVTEGYDSSVRFKITITRECTDTPSNDNQYSFIGWILLLVIMFAAVPVFAWTVLSAFDPELSSKVVDNYFFYIKKAYYLVIAGIGILTSVLLKVLIVLIGMILLIVILRAAFLYF